MPTGYRGLDVSAIPDGTTVTIGRTGNSNSNTTRQKAHGDTLFIIYNRQNGAVGFAGTSDSATASQVISFSIAHDATLAGDGTVLDPLRVVGGGGNPVTGITETVDNTNRRIVLTLTRQDGSTETVDIDLPAATALPPSATQA